MSSSKEQFSLIYDQYVEKIYRFVYLKVNSREVAEDITSKTFLKGWESYQNSREIKNINAFLYRIAGNAVIDHYRDKAKAKIVSTDNAVQIPDRTMNLHERAILNADIESIKTSIQKLKQEYQDVIIWHYLDDMSDEEISLILNKPVGTVRVMIHRGLSELRNMVQEL